MTIENVLLTSISPDPDNARKHDERDILAKMAILRKYGQQKPLVVDKNDVIVAGNGFYEAARRLEYKTISVVRTGLEGAEARLYAIADNRTGEMSTWNLPVLQATLGVLALDGLDLTVTGWNDIEIQGMLPDDGLDLDSVEGDGTGEGSDGTPRELEISHVRMVQLFLDVDTFPEFSEMVSNLGKLYETDNATDTVMECLRRADNQLSS
jgi:hypothetical protein